MEKERKKSTQISPSRLISLSDPIFAFAMTLLIVTINLPENTKENSGTEYLMAQYHNFGPVIIAFLFLASFWLIYNQFFNHIKKTNGMVDILNIIILLCVIFIPFSTSLVNDFPKDIVTGVFLNINIFILACLLSINWLYCREKNFVEKMSQDHRKRIKKGILILLITPIVALLIGLFSPKLSFLLYLICLFVLLIITNSKKKK